MTVDCFFIAWNEEETIHLTIRHYKKFCRTVTVLDNFSTDRTRQIAYLEGAEVQLFGIEGQLNDGEYIKVKNNIWKCSDADWVIVCDADEIFIPEFDDDWWRSTIIRTQGYNMFSNEIPKEDWLEIKTGVKDDNYSKWVCFNPKAITEIGYVYGCHEARPKGYDVRFSNTTAKLLHYKHVGGAERIANRHALYASRLAPINLKHKLGYQYLEPRHKTIEYFNENLKKSVILF